MEELEAKRMKKPVKIGLWLLGFAVLGLLGLWLEHERAKARLAAFKADLIAKGEKLAIADHVPKLPPALSNAAPDFLAAANRLTELKAEWQPARMRMVAPGKARVTWQQAELPTDKDMDIWPIVTAHVEDNRHLLTEMAVALERPEMVFNLDYTKGFSLLLPHLSKVKRAASALALGATVDLRSDQTNSAFTNLLAAALLCQRYQEPLLISELVRAACGSIVLNATWEGLQHSGWRDSQLRDLQAAWQGQGTGSNMIAAWNMERAISGSVFQRCRGDYEYYDQLGGASSGSGRPFFEELWDDPKEAGERVIRYSKHGLWAIWFSYPDETWTLNHQQVVLDSMRIALRHDIYSTAQRDLEAELKRNGEPGTMLLLSGMVVPPSARYFQKFASFETVRRLTHTAIALHRHRLKHGKFPESLGALVPEFLAEVPRDFMDGQPLRYRLEPDGRFRLWSVGEEFKDDGGDATTVGAQSTNPFDWLKGRDWVWPQPATEAEVAAYHAELAAKRALTAPKPPP
ncbi:MAG: Uncharacterized protein FD161_4674 [Limisphaerales bacterium]|nr:MAG: Uncharacterized protein FD161_4674 [Limisphaerales bacterium]KAG0506732.1 MAG: Uncharacterized protein E1N63_4115 [Limisphaerales bacterium]TXT51716.1 MAG: Uncharacterized protein FD140_1520 [Limisphaerales bacterium]